MNQEEKRKQNELNNYLRDLSTASFSEEQLIDKSRILLNIYDGNFRHSYSQIFAIISDIKKKEEDRIQSSLASLEYLSANVQLVQDSIIEHQEFIGIKPFLNKLYDHVMLEISRLNYISTLSDKQRDLDKRLSDSTNQVEEANRSLKSTIKETENLKSEMISVIGIFAAIMLAFVGGMNFTSATLSSINQSSIYKITFITIICGFTIFNTVFCLMYLIARMTNKNIYSFCKNGDCITAECKNNCGVDKIRKRLPFVFWTNIIMLAGIAIVVILWFFDIKIIAEAVRSIIWNKLN